MERRVTSTVAPGRPEHGRAPQQLGPDLGNASGRIAVTKADKGVAPVGTGAAPVVTPASPTGHVGLIDAPDHTLIRAKLSEYLDGPIDAGLRSRIDRHLAACADCTAYLETLRATVGVLENLPVPKAPSARIARVLEESRQLDTSGAAPAHTPDA